MSYTYLLEQGEESSAECFSDIPAFVLSRLNLTAETYSSSGSVMESCPNSQYGTMPAPSTADRGEGSSMSCVVAIPAKEIAMLPAMVFPLRAWEISLSVSLTKCDPRRFLERILSQSEKTLPGLQSECEMPWKGLGIQPLWSSWGHVVWEVTSQRCDHGSSPFRAPNARDWKGMSAKSWRERKVGDTTPTLPDQIGGVPHPEFAEQLIGWPIGWTELKPLGTGSFQQWLLEYFNS